MNKIEKCVFTQPQRCRVITKGTLSKLLFVLIVYFTTIKLYGEMVFNVFENDSLQMVIYEALSCVDDPEVRVVIHDNNIDLGNQFILIDFISSSPVNTKLTLQGCNTQIIFNQNYHPVYDSAIRVLGLSNDPNNQKRLCIDSIDFRYYGADHTKSGIRIWYGLQSFELTNCSFSNMGYGLTYVQGASSPVCNMSISNCTFDQPLGWGPQNNYGFCSYRINYSTNYYSAPDVPIQINLNIFNNTISGIAACGEIELTNVFSTVNIFDNEFSYINPTFSSNMGARELDLHYSGTTLNEVDNAVFNIYNNEFKNWFIYISGCNGTIKWNKFTKTHENYHINYFIDMFPYAANNAISYVNIYKNEFYGCNRFAIHPYNYGAGIGHYNTSIDYNSFFGPGGVMELDSTPEQLNGPQMISSFSNNLIACEGEPINEVNQNVAISVRGYLDTTFINDIVLDIPIEIYRCVFESEDLYVNLSSFTKVGCFTENELYDVDYQNGTYNLTWSHDDKSKAINNGSQIPQFNILSDPDGTPPDIGAIYYPHFNRTYDFSRSPFTGSNIFWMSFPVIDDRSHEGEQHYDMLGYLFEEQMEYAPTFNQLNSASWSYNLDFDNMHYDNVQHLWDNDDKEVTQPQGFKLKFNDGDISPIVVIGFKVDHETTPVELAINTGDNLPFDNWIGYYVPDVQLAGVALSRLLPNSQNETYLDHIYRIKAQYWSTERISPEYGSRWIVDPNHYTLSEGDMISIFLLPNAPKSLYWNTPHISVDPRIRELPVNFTYKEELDYTPIFIEFDPNDLPQEVGLYVSGVCKGAAVVDSSLIEVNYYGTEAKSGDEIEVMFYYGDKGMKKAPAAYVYNPETLLFEAGSLKASNLGDYGYLSFNRGEGSSLVPLVTELKQNYPNPFKAQTNISWILAKDAPVSVDIYNLRGQKVKTLFSGLGQKGRQSLAWDATDLHGNKVASGVYFWRLSTPETTKVQKMLVLK